MRKTVAMLLAAVFALPPVVSGTGIDADEYEVKAAMYINLLRLVDWPTGKRGDASSPFVIGVSGSEEMARALEALVRTKGTPGAGRISVRRISGTTGLDECHSVFIGGGDKKKIQATLQLLSRSPVLTVGENDRFLASGGMIDLMLRDDRIQIEINLDVAQRAGLTISSQLLKIAVLKPGATP